jgi:hypothetical protein
MILIPHDLLNIIRQFAGPKPSVEIAYKNVLKEFTSTKKFQDLRENLDRYHTPVLYYRFQLLSRYYPYAIDPEDIDPGDIQPTGESFGSRIDNVVLNLEIRY